MPEAVIVSAARTPIGRAFKGSLKDLRPDDLTATIVEAALAKVPELDPTHIDDLMLGCGLPGGEQGHNLGRVVAVQLGMDDLPGSTDHPLLLLLAPDHPHGPARHQGGRGRRLHLRRCRDGLALRKRQLRRPARTPTTPSSPTPRPVPPPSRRAEGSTWHDPREDGLVPDAYIAMGQTAENLARAKGVTRQDMDEFGVRSQNLAEEALANGFWEREITPVTTARRHGRQPRTTARAPASPSRASRASSPSSAPTAWSPPATAARSTTAPPRWSS